MVIKETTESVETEEVAEELQEKKEEAVPVFTLEILKVIKDAQQQHGLRHSDFQRYRGYCTRRIKRLRKTLHLPQGDKRHFKRRDVTETLLKDERYLYIPLMLAERAWAYAMQLRQEANTEPRKKFHLVSRMRKASFYANQLNSLCQADVCDARSKLESQAYLAWINGTMHFELHLWKEAMDNFQQAQVVYEKLCTAVDEPDQVTYKQKCDELIPNLRYCAYNIGDTSAMNDLKSFRDFAQGDMLDKLEALMAQARDKQGAGVQEIQWRGKTIAVKPAKVADFLLEEQERDSLKSEGSTQAQLDSLERHIIRCKDAMAVVRDEISTEQSGKQKGGVNLAQLQDLLTYLTYIRLKRSNERTLLMIESSKSNLTEGGSTGEGRKTKAQDLIRLYEIVIQNLVDMQQLPGTSDDGDYQRNVESLMNAYKAFRCYYIAEALTTTKKFREAIVLYDKSINYANDCPGVETSLVAQLSELVGKVESAKCICLAQAVLQKNEEVNAVNVVQTILDKKQFSKVPLAERLDEYREDPRFASKTPNLIKLPPDMQPVPCKPLFFDVALNHIKLPVLDDKLEKKVPASQAGISGFVKGLWSWGGGSK